MSYLDVARTAADKYIQNGIEPTTGVFYGTVPIGGVGGGPMNFGEEERLYQSLVLLWKLTGNNTYFQVGQRAVDGLLTYAAGVTGLVPSGDGSAFMPPSTKVGPSGFTENVVPLLAVYELASDKSKVVKMMDAYYNYHALSDGEICDKVNIDTGSCVGGANHDAAIAAVTVALVEAWKATGNTKYLQRVNTIWNYFSTIGDMVAGQGAKGIFYSATDSGGRRWYVKNYSWEYAYGLGWALKYLTDQSSIVFQAAKKHMDALLLYSLSVGNGYYANPIDVDSGSWEANMWYLKDSSMPQFAEYYQDLCLLQLYRLTGDLKYLNAFNANSPSSIPPIATFPTHNIPPIIENNVLAYQITGDVKYLNQARQVADVLCSWIISKDYWIYGGLEAESDQYVGTDNFFHCVLALLKLAEVAGVVQHTLTVNTSPIQGIPFTVT